MTQKSGDEDDIGLPPGDEKPGPYRATSFMRGGGKGGTGYLWFSCKEPSRDRILPLANLREMEPGDLSGPKAFLHFSGMVVELEGTLLRRVVHRIFLGRCTTVHEIRDGQQAGKSDEPVIRSITFLVPPPPEKAGAASNKSGIERKF
jgi:hypothetical protein